MAKTFQVCDCKCLCDGARGIIVVGIGNHLDGHLDVPARVPTWISKTTGVLHCESRRRGLEPVRFALGNALHALEELGVLFVLDDCVVAACCAIVDKTFKLIGNSLHGCGRMTVISGRFWRGASLRGLRQAVARVVGILGRRW